MTSWQTLAVIPKSMEKCRENRHLSIHHPHESFENIDIHQLFSSCK